MTYILRTTRGRFEQTRSFATAVDAVTALDSPGATPTRVATIDKMGLLITEAELRRDADHESSQQRTDLPSVDLL